MKPVKPSARWPPLLLPECKIVLLDSSKSQLVSVASKRQSCSSTQQQNLLFRLWGSTEAMSFLLPSSSPPLVIKAVGLLWSSSQAGGVRLCIRSSLLVARYEQSSLFSLKTHLCSETLFPCSGYHTLSLYSSVCIQHMFLICSC